MKNKWEKIENIKNKKKSSSQDLGPDSGIKLV